MMRRLWLQLKYLRLLRVLYSIQASEYSIEDERANIAAKTILRDQLFGELRLMHRPETDEPLPDSLMRQDVRSIVPQITQKRITK